ncbi:MAG: peptide deformylase, partial [Gammaproteobacteria bacterium]|nr:peptide deformylase [Gammaproteobacteria bacterium]
DEEEVEGQDPKPLPKRHGLFFLIDPVLKVGEGEHTYTEGCLSIPEEYEEVTRFGRIVVEYTDRDGKRRELQAGQSLLSVCVQHEMDHLEGKLFVDYLSDLKRERIRKKLDKERKERREPATPSSARARAF